VFNLENNSSILAAGGVERMNKMPPVDIAFVNDDEQLLFDANRHTE
jgi:hypothetical protein